MWLQSDCVSNNNVYNLRNRSKPPPNLHFARKAKKNITYVLSSGSSREEDHNDLSVRPGKWSKKCVQNIHVPTGGPSLARQAAQQKIWEQKKAVTVEALLMLSTITTGNNTNVTIGSASTTGENITSMDDVEPRNIMDINEQIGDPPDTSDQNSTPQYPSDDLNNTGDNGDNGSNGSTLDSDDLSLSELKLKEEEENMPLAELKAKEEENIPLSELRK